MLPGMPTRLLQGRVSPAAHAAAKHSADELGLSIAAYLDRLVLADEQKHFLDRPTPVYEQQRAV